MFESGGGSGGWVGWFIGSSSWVTYGGVTLEGNYDYILGGLEQQKGVPNADCQVPNKNREIRLSLGIWQSAIGILPEL